MTSKDLWESSAHLVIDGIPFFATLSTSDPIAFVVHALRRRSHHSYIAESYQDPSQGNNKVGCP